MLSVYENILAPKLNVAKHCNPGHAPTPCWANGYNISGEPINEWYLVSAILADGSSIAFSDMTNFDYNLYGFKIHVDLNGLKIPNKLGKDRFEFRVETRTNYFLKPEGYNRYEHMNPERTECFTGDGNTCAFTIIMYDNWNIANDYPW